MIVNLCAPTFDVCDSYGRKASELAAGLAAYGWHVNKFDTDGSAGSPSILPAVGGILLGYPTNHNLFGALCNTGPRIAICVFESTKIPEEWVDAFNKCDAVIVHSKFLVDVYREAGVVVPIHLIPLGVSDEFLKPVKRERSTPFTFLGIGDRGDRKAGMKLAFAFNRAFGDDTDYKLIIKSRYFPIRFGNPNIELIVDDYSNEEMAELYASCHVMAFPTRGEGFGIPPREFAATGGLVLATNWGGTADDISRWGVPLPYKMISAWKEKSEWYGKMGQWADVDEDALADLMKHVVKHYDSYAQFMMDASEWVNKNYQWSTFVDAVKAIYEDVLENSYASRTSRNHQTA